MLRVTGSNSLFVSALSTDGNDSTQLVDYLRNDKSGTTAHKYTAGKNNSKYNGVKSAASELKTLASKLSDPQNDSLFAKAEADGDKQEVIGTVTDFVNKYNTLLKKLDALGTDKAATYAGGLKEVIASKSEQLAGIGITSDEKGGLVLDSQKLADAEIADLKALFHGSGSLAEQIADKSVYIGASAAAEQYADGFANYTAGGTAADYMQMAGIVGGYLDSLS